MRPLSLLLSMCSLGTFSLLLEGSDRQHMSRLGLDNLHRVKHQLFTLSTWHEEWYVLNWLPSQTGQPHGLVTGWEQEAAGHDFFTHRTEPLCKRISVTWCLKSLTSRSVYVNVCVLMLPGRYIQSRGFLGQGSTVHLWGPRCYRNSLSNKERFIFSSCNQGNNEQTKFKIKDPKLGMWAESDFVLTYVHILHSIVQVVCKGGCTLHNRASWCRWPPLHNSNTLHRGLCHHQTQCHQDILYHETCSLQVEGEIGY